MHFIVESKKLKTQKLNGRRYHGQQIYKITEKGINKFLKKGDHIYLDAAHCDHLEVFDSYGRFKTVLNLDGTVNEAKVIDAWKQGGRDIGNLIK